MIPKRSGRSSTSPRWPASWAAAPPPGVGYDIAYNTSKAALLNFTRALRVRVGKVRHQRERDLPRLLPLEDVARAVEKIEKSVIAATPLGRLAARRT